MPIPSTTVVWDEPMDPSDVADYVINLSTLLDNDNVASYSIAPTADAILLGLILGTSDYAPKLTGTSLRIWLSIDSAKQGSSSFDGDGATLPLEISIVTDSVPARRKQRTVAVKVAQR